MNVYQLDPLEDSRWTEFVERRPDSSIFHTSGWLNAIRSTYGYEPVVYTTTPSGRDLEDGIVFCKVRSWLTGSRIVSLPFSDHCQPLVNRPESFTALMGQFKESLPQQGWRYCEFRPLSVGGLSANPDLGLVKSESYCLHVLDLRPDVDTLFRTFHKSCVQRKIHRAEREQLTYDEGRSEELLQQFYRLLLMTRRRHGLPPQPLRWFQNLTENLGDRVVIRVASREGQPVASILTILHKKSLVYKYGCSDSRFHNLGGMLMLHWKAIQSAKQTGVLEYDLGRSELDNEGLISFKDNWGAKSLPLDYFRYSNGNSSRTGSPGRKRAVEAVFSRMPDSVLTAAGAFLYRHIG